MKNMRIINRFRETTPEALKKNVTQKIQRIINKAQIGCNDIDDEAFK